MDKLLAETPFLSAPEDWMPSAADGVASATPYVHLLSFVGSARFHTPGYSMGVRQAIFRRYNNTIYTWHHHLHVALVSTWH